MKEHDWSQRVDATKEYCDEKIYWNMIINNINECEKEWTNLLQFIDNHRTKSFTLKQFAIQSKKFENSVETLHTCIYYLSMTKERKELVP